MSRKILGKKIYLAPIEEDEIFIFTEFINDLELSVFTDTFGYIYNIKSEQSYFNQDDNLQLGIHENSSGKLLGMVEFLHIDRKNRKAEIGITIGRGADREQGYGREAMSLMLEYGFRWQNFRTITLTTLAKNERAIHLYRSLGFQEVGYLRQSRWIDGEYVDVLIMDLLSEEFSGDGIHRQVKQFL